jgi:large repetitive protein
MPLLQRKRYLNLNHAGVYAPAPAGGLGLQTSCTAFWEFEDTSWADATGNGTTLTAVDTPTSVSGNVGNAASLGNSLHALTAASNTNILAAAGSFSVAVWVNLPSAIGTSLIFNKRLGTFGNDEWGFGTIFSTSNRWAFSCFNTSSSAFNALGTSGSGDFSTGWHHLVGTYDGGTKALSLYLDGAATGSGATLTGTAGSSASATLNFGRIGAGAVTSQNPLLVDQAGFWKGRILSAGDVTALYNGGSGLSWAAMA